MAIPAGTLTFEAHNADSYLLVSGDNQISPSVRGHLHGRHVRRILKSSAIM